MRKKHWNATTIIETLCGLKKVVSPTITESVDSLRWDDADMPMPPYIRKAYNHPKDAFVSLFRQLTVILECFST